jgi:hypothetical protein
MAMQRCKKDDGYVGMIGTHAVAESMESRCRDDGICVVAAVTSHRRVATGLL